MQSQVQYTQQPIDQFQGINIKQKEIYGDIIERLPVDMSVPSHNEILITDQLFQKKKGIFDKILQNTKNIIILGGLFIILSLPFVDNFITKFITITGKSPYILVGVKALLFMFLYFIIKNLYLVRKNTDSNL